MVLCMLWRPHRFTSSPAACQHVVEVGKCSHALGTDQEVLRQIATRLKAHMSVSTQTLGKQEAPVMLICL